MNDVFEKALINGVYVKEDDGHVLYLPGEEIRYDDEFDVIYSYTRTDAHSIVETELTMSDYGKKWALTKQELEKVKK